MSNVITTNPLILDTAATITFNRPLLVKRIDWIGPATVANTAIVTDIGGNILAQGICAVVNQDVVMWAGPQKLTLKSPFQVTTIDSGKMLVWY